MPIIRSISALVVIIALNSNLNINPKIEITYVKGNLYNQTKPQMLIEPVLNIIHLGQSAVQPESRMHNL